MVFHDVEVLLFSDILTEDTNKYGSISIEQVTLWLFNIAMENGP